MAPRGHPSLPAAALLWAAAVDGAAPLLAPPFRWSLGQSVVCPIGSQDFVLAEEAGGGPLSPDEEPGVAEALRSARERLECQRLELRSLSAGVTVVHDGKILFSEFVGVAKAGGSAAPTGDTGFRIASITKTFTSVMMYKLRDEGRLPPLGIDAPLRSLLPNFSILGAGGGAGITLRNLAMHASGMPRETPACTGCGPPASTQEMLKHIADLEVLSRPWQTTHYSNLGVSLLGRALEVAAGKPWEAYIADDILAPLGMASTGTPPWTDAALLGRMADGQCCPRQPVFSTWCRPSGWSGVGGP
mmetsp:Transcript_131308/g.420147  ORF Transcript_131308/g.420147 Transcript_131308/m.420147 type:complete len:302 (-) Transcript_131308:45-950(-)